MTGELIIRTAPRGDGVTADGRHVRLAAPGDHVLIDGSVVPGPHHQEPPCRHFPRCGGCQLQHLDDGAYASFVADRIASALTTQGLEVPNMLPTALSAPRTRRRASLRIERMGRNVVIGFNEEGSHRIIDMKECHILHPALFALVAPLRALLRPMLRERRQAEVQMTLTDQGVDLLIEKVEVEGLAATEALIAFAETHRLARLSLDEGYGAQARWEPQPVTVTLGGVPVAFPAGGFLQATAEGEAALVASVRRTLDGADSVADLFAGLGTFALALPAGRIYAAEGAREPIRALELAARRSGRAIAVDHRDLFRRPLDPKDLARFDGLVLDPPRAGAKEQMAALAASDIARIAYVSCNPATFARDAKMLIQGGYSLAAIQPVGQFRWSTHVELAAEFRR